MGRIRIIAGSLKGRRIQVPQGQKVRPTGDRVREALFSILGRKVVKARILDAYAGSGALGLEALSRGAHHAIFVEADRQVARQLERNVQGLGLDSRAEVRQEDVLAFLARGGPSRPLDLVLADPPYAEAAAGPFLARIAAPGWLAADGWIVLERDRGAAWLGEAGHGVRRFRTATYGGTCLDFFDVQRA